jgi:hypothetical protein
MTECNETLFPFEAHFSRRVVAQFAGDWLTTEGGSLLLRQADCKIGLLRRVAGCFTDYRQPERIEHRLEELLAQRIYGLALGYEDLNDHEQLRQDPLLGVLAGKRDLGEPLAGKSTLNRLELTPAGSPAAERYNKISYSAEALDALLVDLFLEAHPRAPREIVLDLDATDTPLHGRQEARFFHGYYGLLLFATVRVLRRSSTVCAAAGLEHRRQRRKSPRSATHRAADPWAVVEDQHHPASGLGFLPRRVAGLVRKQRCGLRIRVCAEQAFTEDHQPRDAGSQTRAPAHGKTGAGVHGVRLSHQEKLVAGAARDRQSEKIEGKENPRYLVTSLGKEAWSAQKLYEQLYCARGEMENRIKEQLSLFADRLSTETLRANQLRLYFSSLAYVLVEALRRLGLAGTEWAEAQADTIRLKLLKIAAQVRITARRIWVRYSCAYPWQKVFAAAWTALRC